MGIDPSRIKPTRTTFKGIIPGVEANCTGSVTLDVVFGSPDNFRSEELIFDIVPFHSGYHALLGRTAFAKFNAVPHYAYLKLKMPGPRGVITVNGNTEPSEQRSTQKPLQWKFKAASPGSSPVRPLKGRTPSSAPGVTYKKTAWHDPSRRSNAAPTPTLAKRRRQYFPYITTLWKYHGHRGRGAITARPKHGLNRTRGC